MQYRWITSELQLVRIVQLKHGKRKENDTRGMLNKTGIIYKPYMASQSEKYEAWSIDRSIRENINLLKTQLSY